MVFALLSGMHRQVAVTQDVNERSIGNPALGGGQDGTMMLKDPSFSDNVARPRWPGLECTCCDDAQPDCCSSAQA